MPISILIRILIGAVSTISAACIVAGVISKTSIIDKIKEFIRNHKYKAKSKDKTKTKDKSKDVDQDLDEDEDIIGAMIREVSKNKKTVKADILNANHEVVGTEVFEGEGVSSDIYEGAIILV